MEEVFTFVEHCIVRSNTLRGCSAVSGRGTPGALAAVQHGSDKLRVSVVTLPVNHQLLHVFPDSLHPAHTGPVEETPGHGYRGQQEQGDEDS